MKNNTRKTIEKQESYCFPERREEFLEQIVEQELGAALYTSRDNEELALNGGDIIFYYPTSEIHENQVSLYSYPDTGHYLFGFLYENFGEIGILDFQDGQYLKTVKRTEIKIAGFIVAVVKPFDARKLPTYPYEIKAEQPEEITVVCDECKKEIKGTKDFLKSEGWKLKKDETLCLNCDLGGEI